MDTLALECANILRAGGNATHDYPIRGFGGVYNGENGIARIANHILGGARFGSDPRDSVLDPDCRVWGFDNLYVTDGAFMPTSGGANPTLTIEANSFRVADKIGGRL
jgi:choline dehydrogenase-like flavoprotein